MKRYKPSGGVIGFVVLLFLPFCSFLSFTVLPFKSDTGTANKACDLNTLMVLVPSIATVSANLLLVPTAREPPHANSGPPQLAHQLCQSPARTGSSTTLRDLKDVE
jgi:hypothetical protein